MSQRHARQQSFHSRLGGALTRLLQAALIAIAILIGYGMLTAAGGQDDPSSQIPLQTERR